MNNKYKEYIKYTILILCSVIFAIFTYKVVADKTIYIDSIVYTSNLVAGNNILDSNIIHKIFSILLIILLFFIFITLIKFRKHRKKNDVFMKFYK